MIKSTTAIFLFLLAGNLAVLKDIKSTSNSNTRGEDISMISNNNYNAPFLNSDLEVNGFTQLGEDAPSIKMKKLTGTLHENEGFAKNIPHGLGSGDRILAVSVHVQWSEGSNSYIHDSYTNSGDFLFNYTYDNNNVVLRNAVGNSASITGDSVVVLITYE